MYSALTSAILFVALVPGVILSVGSGITAAVIHGVVFYVVQQFLFQYVPWWILWAVVIIAVGLKLFGGSPYATPSY
jgi:uncharacterized membrane protein YgdD (TMEM256/DUF423 family)